MKKAYAFAKSVDVVIGKIEIRFLKDNVDIKERIRAQTLQRKIFVLTHYGNDNCACVKCGFDNIKALSLDHIDGRINGGDKLKGDSSYRWLIRNNFPLGYQTLCLNCQFIKREENNEFRNQYTGRKT